MANPQAENGHTDIANEIIEALARIRISGEAMQIILFILRKTYGWKKIKDRISLSQFVLGTNLPKSSICRALKKLINMNLISIDKNVNDSIRIYMFNKDFDTWKPLTKKSIFTKLSKGIDKNVNKTIDKNVKQQKKLYTKETITKDIGYLFSQIESNFTEEELKSKHEFLEWWKAKNPGGKKELWQMEKVFDIKRRFRTWLNNRKKWDNKPPKATGGLRYVDNLFKNKEK